MNKKLLEDFVDLMDDLQSSEDNKDDVIYAIIKFIRDKLNICSVAIRIKDGKDFPFYTSLGFSDKFIKMENFLCCSHDSCDHPCDNHLECMCGAIINKKQQVDHTNKSCHTENGSFWTNSSTDTIGDVNISRGTCIKTGYKTIVISPISYNGVNIGLIQLNDYQENKVNKNIVEAIEEIGSIIGATLGKFHFHKLNQIQKKEAIKNNVKFIIQELITLSESILKKKENSV